MGALLTHYRDVFQLAARPRPLVRGALAALGAVGRLRGYRVRGVCAVRPGVCAPPG